MAAPPLFTELFDTPSELAPQAHFDHALAPAPNTNDHPSQLAPAFRQGPQQLWAPQARPVVKMEHDTSLSYLPNHPAMANSYQATDRALVASASGRFQLPPTASFTRPGQSGHAEHSLLPPSSLFDDLAQPWPAEADELEAEVPGGVNEQHFSRSSSPSPPDGDSPVDGHAMQSPDFVPVRPAPAHHHKQSMSLFGAAPMVLEADRPFVGSTLDMDLDLPPSSWSDLALQQQAVHDTFSLDIFYDGAIMTADRRDTGKGYVEDCAVGHAALPAPVASHSLQWFHEQPAYHPRAGSDQAHPCAPVAVAGPAMVSVVKAEEVGDDISPSSTPTPGGSANGRKRVRHRRRRWTQTQSKRKAYTCETCGLVLQGHSTLVRHMRIHTGEKPFMCEDCGVSFRQKGTLTSHMVTHTGDLPFHCEYCDQRFRHRATMKRHVANMHGGKPITKAARTHAAPQPVQMGLVD